MTEASTSIIYLVAQTDHIKLSSIVKRNLNKIGQTPCDYLYFKAFYTLHDFSNPIRSLQISLCDMDLINLATTCM